MTAGTIKTRENCRWLRLACNNRLNGFKKVSGRHVGTRTPDLYRVNFEVTNLKTFAHLRFPQKQAPEANLKCRVLMAN